MARVVRVLDTGINSLAYIRRWFEETYGITITASQAVEFAIHTVDVQTATKLLKITHAVATKLPSHRIRINERSWKRLGAICENSWGLIGTNDETIITAIVMCRASTLPIKKAQP